MVIGDVVREERSRLSRVRRRFAGPQAELQELFLVLLALGWGSVIALWHSETDVFEASPIFRTMVRVAPDHIWSTALIVTGLAGLIGWVFQLRNLRRICAVVGTFGWALVSYLVWVHPEPALGLVVLPIATLMSVVTLARLEVTPR